MLKIFDAFVTLKDVNSRAGRELGRIEINRSSKTHVFGENFDGAIYRILKDDIFKVIDMDGYSRNIALI